MISDLTFDEATHTYTMGGVEVMSVTQVLKWAGMTARYFDTLPAGNMQLGHMLHEACYYDLRVGLEPHELTGSIREHFERWKEWREDHILVPWLLEYRAGCPVYRYAGTMDFFGLLDGQPWLIDWKRHHYHASNDLQIAGGYLPLVERWLKEHAKPKQRALVDKHGIRCGSLSIGAKKLTTIDPEGKREVFRAALLVHQWRKAHGLAS